MHRENIDLIFKAASFAAEAHAFQKRKVIGEPYVNHPIRVAREAWKVDLPIEAVVAAFLHDTVEDTPVRLEELSEIFPTRVVDLVRLMTKWWPDDAEPEVKEREKPRYYGAILQDQDAIHLKLLDRADNLADMARMLPKARDWAERYLMKTEKEFGPLLQAARNPVVRQVFEDALKALRGALA